MKWPGVELELGDTGQWTVDFALEGRVDCPPMGISIIVAVTQ